MCKNIEDMLKEFNNNADDIMNLLQETFNVVSEGRVPQESEVKKMDRFISDLRQKYNSIYSIALEQVSADEMPKEGGTCCGIC